MTKGATVQTERGLVVRQVAVKLQDQGARPAGQHPVHGGRQRQGGGPDPPCLGDLDHTLEEDRERRTRALALGRAMRAKREAEDSERAADARKPLSP